MMQSDVDGATLVISERIHPWRYECHPCTVANSNFWHHAWSSINPAKSSASNSSWRPGRRYTTKTPGGSEQPGTEIEEELETDPPEGGWDDVPEAALAADTDDKSTMSDRICLQLMHCKAEVGHRKSHEPQTQVREGADIRSRCETRIVCTCRNCEDAVHHRTQTE